MRRRKGIKQFHSQHGSRLYEVNTHLRVWVKVSLIAICSARNKINKGREKKHTHLDDSYRKEEKKQKEMEQGRNTILLSIDHIESCTANQVHSHQNKKPGWRRGQENKKHFVSYCQVQQCLLVLTQDTQ